MTDIFSYYYWLKRHSVSLNLANFSSILVKLNVRSVSLDPLMYADPFAANNQKAVEMVGANLQHQYERWQPRARYKLSLDPTVDDVRKLCSSLRRNAKDERVLFHYNGHGVPRPTANGEIWVFNKVQRHSFFLPQLIMCAILSWL